MPALALIRRDQQRGETGDASGDEIALERTFLAALYSFYNTHDSVLLWEKAGIRGFADLSGLDLVRRKLIAELLLNYVGW